MVVRRGRMIKRKQGSAEPEKEMEHSWKTAAACALYLYNI